MGGSIISKAILKINLEVLSEIKYDYTLWPAIQILNMPQKFL